MFAALSLLGHAIRSVIAVGAIWWVVDHFHTVNGVGLLARQSWPFNDFYLFAAGGAVAGLVQGVLQQRGRRQRAAQLAETAQLLNFERTPVVKACGVSDMPLFAHWNSAENGMIGQRDGVDIEIFDFTAVEKRDEDSVTTRRTVVLLPASDVHNFDLRPRKSGYRLLSWLGMPGMTFDHRAVPDPEEAAIVKRFDQLFYVSLPGQPAWAQHESTVSADDELMLRRLFVPTVMAAFSNHPDASAQACAGLLAIWHGEGHRAPAEWPQLVDAAVEIRAALLRGQAFTSELVPTRLGTSLGAQREHLTPAVLGAIIGGLAGFFCGAVASAALFHHAGTFHSVLACGVFFGSIAAGAGIGAMIGSRFRLPLRATVPSQRPQPKGIPLLFSVVFLAFGCVAIGVAVLTGYSSATFASAALRTEGTVIADTGQPLIRYHVGDREYQFRGFMNSEPPLYHVGEKVEVLYLSDRPSEGRINSFIDLWLMTLIFGGTGCVLVAVGLAGVRNRRLQK